MFSELSTSLQQQRHKLALFGFFLPLLLSLLPVGFLCWALVKEYSQLNEFSVMVISLYGFWMACCFGIALILGCLAFCTIQLLAFLLSRAFIPSQS